MKNSPYRLLIKYLLPNRFVAVLLSAGVPAISSEPEKACGLAPERLTVFEAEACFPSTSKCLFHYNWMRAGSERTLGASQGLLEPLYFLDPATTEVVPWLAETPRWAKDGLSVEISLNRFAAWSDGTPVTAKDLVFSFRTALDHVELNGPHMAEIRRLVADVVETGVRRVRLDLYSPAPSLFVDHLAAGASDAFPILPAHRWSTDDPVEFINAVPLGTGPYIADSEARAPVRRWVRNDAWWAVRARLARLPAPTELVWVPAQASPEETARWIACGGADIALGLSPGVAAGLEDIAPFLSPIQGADGRGLLSDVVWSGWADTAEPDLETLRGQAAQLILRNLRSAR